MPYHLGDYSRVTGNPELIGRDSQFLYFAESPEFKVDRQKIAPDDCASPDFLPQNKAADRITARR